VLFEPTRLMLAIIAAAAGVSGDAARLRKVSSTHQRATLVNNPPLRNGSEGDDPAGYSDRD
jgi:hypothetical protein